jgi:hypothetical protein
VGVDPEVAELTSAAAIAMTKLLVTDGWEAAKNLFVSLWRRVHPERADRVGADLAQARDDLLASPQADVPQLEAGLADEWQGRLRSLLAANPWLASELRRILDTEFRPALAESNGGVAPVITMHARVDGGGSVYQAGRDQHIGRDLRRDPAARCPPVRPVGRDRGRIAPGGTSIRWR